jgi:hypothetical protein
MTRPARRWWLAAAAVIVLAAAAVTAVALAGREPGLTVRDRDWRQDVAYLARELPRARIDGLGRVSRAAWLAAAQRLEAQVPRLTGGQVIAGMARLVALLHDDETQLVLPPSPVYPFAACWIGSGLYLIGVPAADRWLLGARLVAVDARPIAQVLSRLRAVIGQQASDPIDEFGNDSHLLHLPHYGVLVQVTTAVINSTQIRYGIPAIKVAPTLADWLTGRDPVLARALAAH